MNEIAQYKNQLLERFLCYVGFDTQSKSNTKTSPSSIGQMKLAKYLQQELYALGLQNITLDKNGVLTALLPSNVSPKMPTIGFIAHLDTSPQCSGKHIRPEIIENYRGGDIALGLGEKFISPVYYHFLHHLIGKTLIVTDGNTLLGADSKGGIAEIITALAFLKDTSFPHCNICVAFCPDKEIGLGTKILPLDKFPCNWAYTVSGGEVGELGCENFNAAYADITFHGQNSDVGKAKNNLINALALACEFQQSLPQQEMAENSEGEQGFFHLATFNGNIEHSKIQYWIRDFNKIRFEQRKQFLQNLVDNFNTKKKLKRKVELEIRDHYYNIAESPISLSNAVALADKAMKNCGIKPLHKAIRTDTEGAKLALKGMACPTLFTGAYNLQSNYELITLEGMLESVKLIVQISHCAMKPI